MDIIVPDTHFYLFGKEGRMAQLGLVTYPDEVLREVAKPVVKYDKKLRKIVNRMKSVVQHTRGIGIAAPQIGESVRVIIMATQDTKVVVNPSIVYLSDSFVETTEGCLSVPGLFGDVPRAATAVVDGFDLEGKAVRHLCSGMEAIVAQHEIDHLDGVLFFDKARVETLNWQLPD